MQRVAALIRLARPHFLGGGVAGVVLGAALARRDGARIDVATYLWAQALVSALQLMVHFANDYFDREGDAGGMPLAWSGGSGVLVAGALPARAALVAAVACAALGLAATARFALAGNGAAAVLGVAIAAGAWCYSAPPARLCARGLGELDAALVVGVLVPAAGYAAFAGIPSAALWSSTAATFAAMLALMLCVEVPDARSDAAAGKRNLVVRLGAATTGMTIALVAALAVSLAFAVAARGGVPPASFLALLPLVAIAAALLRALGSGDRRPATIAALGVFLYAASSLGLATAVALAG